MPPPRLSLRAPALLLVAALASACGDARGPGARPTVAPAPTPALADAPVDRAALRFASDDDAAAFDRVRACYAARGAPRGRAPVDPMQHVLEGRWKHTPLRRQGPHVRETWCAGPIACEIGWSRRVPGVDWARISTILDHGAWPRVHGLYLDIGHTPRGEGWSVALEWSRGAEPIHFDSLHVLFYRDVTDASGRPAASDDDDSDGVETLSIQLGHSLQYTAYGTPIGVRAPGSPRDTLDALRGSPESLRRHGEALLDALEAKVVATIEAGELRRCIDHPSPIDGRPPICERVPLTASETQAAVDAARAALADDRERVRTEADELHALILRVLPPECL